MEEQEIKFDTRRSRMTEWNYSAELYAFGARLGETFDEHLLREAFTSPEYIATESAKRKEMGVDEANLELSNYRNLASIGEQIIAEYSSAFIRYSLPHFPEEGVKAIRDYLISEEVLSHVCMHLGTRDLMLHPEYPAPKQVFADVLKAIVGAISKSANQIRAEQFVQDLILVQLIGKDVNELWDVVDPMGQLASILAREGRGEPEPRLLRKTGQNTIMACYEVGIYLNKKLIGRGPGETVEAAQEMAARDAIRRLFATRENMAPMPFGKKIAEFKELRARFDKPNIDINQWTKQRAHSNIVQC